MAVSPPQYGETVKMKQPHIMTEPTLLYHGKIDWLCSSMWLFHLHSAVKIQPFSPVFPLAEFMVKAFFRLAVFKFVVDTRFQLERKSSLEIIWRSRNNSSKLDFM